MEEVMLDLMFDIPSRKDVDTCYISRETVLKISEPVLTPRKAAIG